MRRLFAKTQPLAEIFDCKARRIRRVSAPNSAPVQVVRRARRPGQLLGRLPGL